MNRRDKENECLFCRKINQRYSYCQKFVFSLVLFMVTINKILVRNNRTSSAEVNVDN